MGDIQFITNDPKRSVMFEEDGLIMSTYGRARNFDEFKFNVINLQESEIWKCYKTKHQTINNSNDLCSLGRILASTKTAKTIILLPQDTIFYFDYNDFCNRYDSSIRIKDMLSDVTLNILEPLHGRSYELNPGVSSTVLNGNSYESDFVIQPKNTFCSIECESIAGQPTVIRIENLYLCTIKISNRYALHDLMREMGLESDVCTPIPEWLDDVPFRNEDEIREDIIKKEAQISQLKEDCENQKTILEANKRLKSILCTKDSVLEDNVREMLAAILDVPNDFRDEGEEDFRVIQEGHIFLFEIKGSTRNLKREQITKTDSHVQMYLDENDENGSMEQPKGVLIFADQIEKPPEERDSYPNEQIKLAKRDNVIVISTRVFLLIYEGILGGLWTKEELLDLLWSCNGELVLSNLPRNLQELHRNPQ